MRVNRHDLRLLIQQLGLNVKNLPKHFTYRARQNSSAFFNGFEWWVGKEPGSNFGEQWSSYRVEYTGVVVSMTSEPRAEKLTMGLGWHIYHPEDERKVVWICRIRIIHSPTRAYLEVRYKHRLRPEFEIKNLQKDTNDETFRKVWAGRQLFMKAIKRGRPYGSYYVSDEDLPKALIEVIEAGKQVYQADGQVSKKLIAQRMRGHYAISDEKALSRLLNRAGKNWKRDILPQIKRP